MKSVIKNISRTTLSFFARKNGKDTKFELGPGKELIADRYETRTLKVYLKKGLITMKNHNPKKVVEAPKKEPEIFNNPKDGGTMDPVVNPNTDEALDALHTTANISGATYVDDSITIIDEAMSKEEIPSAPFKTNLDPDDPTSFEVIEGNVKKYVENGYVKGSWTDEDEEFLRKNYPSKGRKYCANYLNRNESSVQKKINALGLKKKKKK